MTEGRQLRDSIIDYRLGVSGDWTSVDVTGANADLDSRVISRRELSSQGRGCQ